MRNSICFIIIWLLTANQSYANDKRFPEKLQGEWKLDSAEGGGYNLTDIKLTFVPTKVIVQSDKIRLVFSRFDLKGTIQIVDREKRHIKVDFENGSVYACIILDDNRFVAAVSPPKSTGFPSSFNTLNKENPTIYIFIREK